MRSFYCAAFTWTVAVFDSEITAAASALVAKLRAGQHSITTIESCTGGLISAAITVVSGASDVFKAGLVTYSNEAKTALVGVPVLLLDTHGAVSSEVAAAMAIGGLKAAGATLAISATGIAGPNSDGSSKPVGLVYIGLAALQSNKTIVTRVTELRLGNLGRDAVRRETVLKALELALTAETGS